VRCPTGSDGVLLAGLVTLVLADLVLAYVPGLIGVFLGIGLWVTYMGLSQGLLSALVADTAPEDLRGTAFGLFNLLTGGTLLFASVLAGWLWYAYGSTATFVAGAVFSATAIATIAAQTDWHNKPQAAT
jgi:MFS family permease